MSFLLGISTLALAALLALSISERDGETDLRREISRRHVTDLAPRRALWHVMWFTSSRLSPSSPGSSVCLSKHSVFRQPIASRAGTTCLNRVNRNDNRKPDDRSKKNIN